MAEKSEREVYLELAKLSEQSIEKRKDVEWKVAFGFWTAISVFTWFMVQHPEGIGCLLLVCLGVLYLSGFVVWALFWQAPLHDAFLIDKRWKHHYAARAVGLFEPGRPSSSDEDKFLSKNVRSAFQESKAQPWFWGQSLMTAIFLIVSLVVIWAASCSKEHAGDTANRQETGESATHKPVPTATDQREQ